MHVLLYNQVKGKQLLKEDKEMWGKTAKQIRKEAKEGTISYYKKLVKLFESHGDMEIIVEMNKIEDVLHRSYGLSYDEIEKIELSV